MQLIRTKQENYAVEKDVELKASSDILDILKTSCYDCHSNEVNWPWYSKIAPFSWVISEHVNNGRLALNFSNWEKYTQKEKERKMKDIYRTVYAVMPLESYTWLHKNAILNKKEKIIIRSWTGVRKKK